MNLFLYNLSLSAYYLLILVTSFFNKKATLMLSGRKGIMKKINTALANNSSPVIWFHCASLGEFEQGRPLMEEIRKQYPHYKILLTFFSPSGYEVRKNYSGADWIFYLPFDTAKNARRFVEIVKPELAFFVKYEFWYHYLNVLSQKGTPSFLISGLFREDQIFFKSHGEFFRTLLKKFSHIFVQNKKSELLLQQADIKRYSLSGDTRYDRVHAQLGMTQTLPLLEQFKERRPLVIGGSVWKEDMKLLIPYINECSNETRFIIAPHDINMSEISGWRQRISKKSQLYSEVSTANEVDPETRVIFVDSIGLLSSIYRYGNYAHIGGAFGKGLHNILEAATFGMPISFGPNIKKFPEAKNLIDAGGAKSVKTEEEFKWYITESLNPINNKLISEKSRNFVQQNRGATEKIMNYIKQYLQ